MHFTCLSEINIGLMLDSEPIISICLNDVTYIILLLYVLYRYVLETAFRFTLGILVKYGIKTLGY